MSAAQLREAEPLSRDDLSDSEVVEALWNFAESESGVSQSAFGVTEVYRAFEHSNAAYYEIATALDYHDISEVEHNLYSAAFESRLALSS